MSTFYDDDDVDVFECDGYDLVNVMFYFILSFFFWELLLLVWILFSLFHKTERERDNSMFLVCFSFL